MMRLALDIRHRRHRTGRILCLRVLGNSYLIIIKSPGWVKMAKAVTTNGSRDD